MRRFWGEVWQKSHINKKIIPDHAEPLKKVTSQITEDMQQGGVLVKKTLLIGFSALMMSSTAVMSADFGSQNWTGAYAGVFVGGIIPEFDNHWNAGISICDIDCVPDWIADTDLNTPGALAGLRFGSNYDFGGLVAGVEADVSMAWLENNTYYIRPSDGDLDSSERAGLNIDAMASLRGKLGFAMDDFMLYGTAGVSYVSAEFTASSEATDPVMGKQSMSTWAPVIGGGIDWRVSDNVVMGATVLHHMVDNYKYVGPLGNGGTTDSYVKLDSITTLDLSLKYHF